ncbi:hypothetical protein [Vibrio barjaei]|uniref:hypothetical protein n=1 Tax=Vibrio barjaei TaxID=1676683 RepID=UPI0022848487|nr:hypothetical protein [Vibrio barjaei]MCY9873861.1 hypothetical protein [Vibrio barjaei]
MLKAATLRNALAYDKSTGIFTWKDAAPGRKRGQRAGSVRNPRGKPFRQITLNGYTHSTAYLAWLHVTGKHPRLPLQHIDDNRLNDSFDNIAPKINL